MKEKISTFVITFKKVWADERGRALIKLALYIIFVVFATITATATFKSNSSDNNVVTINTLDKYKTIDSYTSTFKINEENYLYSDFSKETLTIDNVSYYIENTNLVNALDSTLTVPTYTFKFWYLTPKFIYNLTQNGEISYTTTFNDGSIEKAYIVPLSYFISSYDGTVLDIENTLSIDGKNIEIITDEKDNEINKIKIDLSTYYVLLDSSKTSYNVEIDY